ncbi:MAG: LysM peptidoglycan-binding domain-containing protein [Elusimicrobiota bacterium]
MRIQNSKKLNSFENRSKSNIFKYRIPTDIKLSASRPIWNKQPKPSWMLMLIFAVVFIVTMTVLAHAAPHRSRGARPIALGNGYTAVSGDVYNLFYNPAGLFNLNQEELSLDYGRSYSKNESARSDFNGIYGFPYRYKEKFVPLAVGFYGEQAAPGAHIIDVTVGGGTDAPADRWTKGFIKFPVKAGLALTLRHQNGEDRASHVGKSKIGLGLTGGFFVPINRQHQVGFALRHLFPGDGDPRGPSLNFGVVRRHLEYLDMFLDLEYGSGGVWRFHPGLEWLLSRGVLRPRLGWGHRDSGAIDHLATGIGFYLSPMQIDISYLIPLKTVTDNSGQFRASFSYRFGRPQFTEIYYDKALEAAGVLDQRVIQLTQEEAQLKNSLSEIEQKRKMAEDELNNMKARIKALKDDDLLGERESTIRSLRERIKELEGNVSHHRHEANELREKKASIKIHTVSAGDTLQSIAREYYGDPNQWRKIYNANPDKIERGLPKTGSKLVIP